ncbi:PREDICTED: LOW QUALITY PROTEIN: bcl-2-like protein 10 [Hipposideros armiger]|uniref:LOW QUALITY PROTEIN: bcl-2-like protein 10 n=1 Tax=Hipposideros armiger TaxID=186990 RepID=A0A8B7T1T0_HIPAR|nr:PREDICTED: LOW QUALITY PROTEIN: bcl-2-like protein 10 [Hipposideros armiger]
MGDALRLPTVRLLTDSLESCSRAAGTATLPPSMPGASVLHSVAAQVQRHYQLVWSCYRGYQGNRIELMEHVAQETLHDRRVPRWGRVVALISFAGTLMQRPPPGRRLELKENMICRHTQRSCGILKEVSQKSIPAITDKVKCPYVLLSTMLDYLQILTHQMFPIMGCLLDGFCHLFTPAPISSWERLLVQVLLSYFTATILTYLWTKFSTSNTMLKKSGY